MVSLDEKSWISELLKRKAIAVEAAPMALDERDSAAIFSEIEKSKAIVGYFSKPMKTEYSVLDVLLRAWVSA